MQAPTLVYPTIRGPPGMDLREQRLEPINNGGDIEGITLDAPTIALRSLRLDTSTGACSAACQEKLEHSPFQEKQKTGTEKGIHADGSGD